MTFKIYFKNIGRYNNLKTLSNFSGVSTDFSTLVNSNILYTMLFVQNIGSYS